MDGLEEKLGSILENPEMMQSIMRMAQSLGSQESEPAAAPPPLPGLDIGALQQISGIMRRANIDPDQQALLHALMPYLKKERIRKLENAMRAAKLADVAAFALKNQGTDPGR